MRTARQQATREVTEPIRKNTGYTTESRVGTSGDFFRILPVHTRRRRWQRGEVPADVVPRGALAENSSRPVGGFGHVVDPVRIEWNPVTSLLIPQQTTTDPRPQTPDHRPPATDPRPQTLGHRPDHRPDHSPPATDPRPQTPKEVRHEHQVSLSLTVCLSRGQPLQHIRRGGRPHEDALPQLVCGRLQSPRQRQRHLLRFGRL